MMRVTYLIINILSPPPSTNRVVQRSLRPGALREVLPGRRAVRQRQRGRHAEAVADHRGHHLWPVEVCGPRPGGQRQRAPHPDLHHLHHSAPRQGRVLIGLVAEHELLIVLGHLTSARQE